MTEQTNGDMTGRDPMSSTAEGDDDPGSAALAEAGTSHPDDDSRPERSRPEQDADPGFAEMPTPAEAYDDTPVEDAVPETNLGHPGH